MIVAMRQPVHTETTDQGRLLTVVHHPGAVVIVPVLVWDRFGGGAAA